MEKSFIQAFRQRRRGFVIIPAICLALAQTIQPTSKTLMLMAFDDSGKIFNASSCGDNCAKWIVDISTRKELTINLHHVLDFSSAGAFEAYMINTGKTVCSYEEYLDEAFRIKER